MSEKENETITFRSGKGEPSKAGPRPGGSREEGSAPNKKARSSIECNSPETKESCEGKETGEFCNADYNQCMCSKSVSACSDGHICNGGQCGMNFYINAIITG